MKNSDLNKGLLELNVYFGIVVQLTKVTFNSDQTLHTYSYLNKIIFKFHVQC